MALTIVVLNLKGGVGKTTTAVALAEAAQRAGVKAVLVDTDPMHGAGRWQELAELSGATLEGAVVGMPTADLPRRLRNTIAADVALIVVDSPPPGALNIARGALAVADIVVIPSPPLPADLDRVRSTISELGAAGRPGVPAWAVLTMTRPTADKHSARAALGQWGVPVFKTELPLRAAVARMYGEPVTGLLAEYGAALLTEVLDVMDAKR